MLTTIHRIADTISRISNHSAIIQGSLCASAFVSSFFIPLVPTVLTCFACILADMYYGIKVAIKQNKRGVPVKIDSHLGWTGTIKKLRDTMITLTLARGLDFYLLSQVTGDAKVLTTTLALIICITEFWSILENMNTLDPKGPWRIVGKLLKKKGSEYVGVNIEELINESVSKKDDKLCKECRRSKDSTNSCAGIIDCNDGNCS